MSIKDDYSSDFDPNDESSTLKEAMVDLYMAIKLRSSD